MSQAAEVDPTGSVDANESVEPELRADDELGAAELIEVLNHCAGLASSTAHRMMTVASLIHDEREIDSAQRRAQTHDGELDSIEAFEELSARAAAGEDPCARFGPSGLELAVAEVGATLTVTPTEARELIAAGDALRYRLLFTGHALACGRIDKKRFLIALKRTDLVTDADEMQTVDAHLAEAIFARAPMSTTRFTAMVDAIVAKWAPDAVRRRRERVTDNRKVTVAPDRFTPGQSRVSGSLPIADAAAFDARLSAMATSVHPADPRTLAQRRADALIALARGEQQLACTCDDCSARETKSPEPQTESVTPPSAPRATFHIVVNLSTLVGADDDPAFLDGHGVVDADTARTLLAEARRTYLHPGTQAHSEGSPDAITTSMWNHTPSKKLQALVRAGELCCTFPGCNAPVWQIDVDHTVPFDHRRPRRGGPTAERNLKPLCRFHHRIKTFTSWQDYQDEFLTAWFTTPTGHMFVGNAYSGRDLFGRLAPIRPPDHPARVRHDTLRDDGARRQRRVDDRWNRANPPPF
ncbi:DUF222 domain-containing protein [Gordonia sp. ABSL1-1]|uniref:HNH endonuclease signature motif containing protein n=1 Tax=Gordonia sp. ABSL1-1 TaxID=3053923 RepID=UPI00257472CF|nr:HNH endonuclease signature motif containing protein [Gordonia sp. ABSL1-1]MDL9937105.1 DUF222 domain-containing protein [Gordonia sp. ABSL1-1]